MEKSSEYSSNKCISCRSLSTVLWPSKSNGTFQLRPSHSLPSCLKIITQEQHSQPSDKTSDPTIGELLGDDDLFHSHYHHQYSSQRYKRKRHYHPSQARSSHFQIHRNRRKRHRSTYSNTHRESSFRKVIEPVPETHQIYRYPTGYTYPPFSAYCYHCYSNTTGCCPYVTSDCYTGFYQQEIYYETSTV